MPSGDRSLNLTGPASNLRPRYNVAPSQKVAAVRAGDDGRSLSMLRWGLIPSWALCKCAAAGRGGVKTPSGGLDALGPILTTLGHPSD